MPNQELQQKELPEKLKQDWRIVTEGIGNRLLKNGYWGISENQGKTSINTGEGYFEFFVVTVNAKYLEIKLVDVEEAKLLTLRVPEKVDRLVLTHSFLAVSATIELHSIK